MLFCVICAICPLYYYCNSALLVFQWKVIDAALLLFNFFSHTQSQKRTLPWCTFTLFTKQNANDNDITSHRHQQQIEMKPPPPPFFHRFRKCLTADYITFVVYNVNKVQLSIVALLLWAEYMYALLFFTVTITHIIIIKCTVHFICSLNKYKGWGGGLAWKNKEKKIK